MQHQDSIMPQMSFLWKWGINMPLFSGSARAESSLAAINKEFLFFKSRVHGKISPDWNYLTQHSKNRHAFPFNKNRKWESKILLSFHTICVQENNEKMKRQLQMKITSTCSCLNQAVLVVIQCLLHGWDHRNGDMLRKVHTWHHK